MIELIEYCVIFMHNIFCFVQTVTHSHKECNILTGGLCNKAQCGEHLQMLAPLTVPLVVGEKVSLQVGFQTPTRLATRRVCDQSQFVEHSSTKVVRHNRKPVIRAVQLK